jgi:hypothetical protein
VFVRDGQSWSQQAFIKAANADFGDHFGVAVAIAGDTLAVGAPGESSGAVGVNGDESDNGTTSAGAVYVFVRDGTSWSQQAYIKAQNSGAGDRFGGALSLSGDTLAVGAVRESSAATGVDNDPSDNSASSAGAAYVFVRNGTSWSQQAYLKASNTGSGDFFGGAVALDGDTLAVGAGGENSAGAEDDNSANDAGAAYVFVRDGVSWSQQQYLKAPNAESNDIFGVSLALEGEMLVIGAPSESSGATEVGGDDSDNSAPGAGAAYVFVRASDVWTQQAI